MPTVPSIQRQRECADLNQEVAIISRMVQQQTRMKQKKVNRHILIEPTRIIWHGRTMEYSVHSVPMLMREELMKIFPELPDIKSCLLIPVIQPCTRSSMTEFTQESEIEKNELLNEFQSFVQALEDKIKEKGDFWIDFPDPVTGYPSKTQYGGMSFSDVDAAELLLRYRMDTVGGTCRIISHPIWGTAVYPATILVCAPLDILKQALSQITQQHKL